MVVVLRARAKKSRLFGGTQPHMTVTPRGVTTTTMNLMTFSPVLLLYASSPASLGPLPCLRASPLAFTSSPLRCRGNHLLFCRPWHCHGVPSSSPAGSAPAHRLFSYFTAFPSEPHRLPLRTVQGSRRNPARFGLSPRGVAAQRLGKSVCGLTKVLRMRHSRG